MNSVIEPHIKSLLSSLKSRKERKLFNRAQVRGTIVQQLKAMRAKREWTQADLARESGKKQSVISRLENPSYGRLNINTLIELAEAFDVGLRVEFASFGSLVQRRMHYSYEALQVPSYDGDALIKDLESTSPPEDQNSAPVYKISSQGDIKSPQVSLGDQRIHPIADTNDPVHALESVAAAGTTRF